MTHKSYSSQVHEREASVVLYQTGAYVLAYSRCFQSELMFFRTFHQTKKLSRAAKCEAAWAEFYVNFWNYEIEFAEGYRNKQSHPHSGKLLFGRSRRKSLILCRTVFRFRLHKLSNATVHLFKFNFN